MTPSTDLVRRDPLDLIDNIDDLARLSQSINRSAYYKDVTSADQVGVKLMVARELGLGIVSISNIYPVKGKITLGYQLLIALVKRSGKYDMRFRTRDEKGCEIEWFERNDEGKLESVGFSKFTMDDAKRAGLTRNDTYAKNPVEMLVARAVSSGFNSYTPECAGGALYSIGELDDDSADERLSAPLPRGNAFPSVPVETMIDVEPVPLGEADGEIPLTPEPVEPEPAKRKRRTKAEMEADAELAKAEEPREHVVVSAPLAERSAASILSDQETNIAAIRELIVTGLEGKERSDCHDSLKYLGIWGAAAPKDLWLAYGKKALAWETLQVCLDDAMRVKLEAESAALDAASAADPGEPLFPGEPGVIDVEPEPEFAPWDQPEGEA